MSLSVDPRQLELLVQFSSFLELLTNHERFQGIVNDVKQAISEYNEKLGLIQTKEAADKYLQDAKANYEGVVKSMTEEQAKFDEYNKKMRLDIEDLKAQTQRTLDSAAKKENEASNNEAKTAEVLQAATNKMIEANAKYRSCTELEAELKKKTDLLNDKLSKFNQLIG